MRKWQILQGLALATAPDIASGVLAVHLVFGYPPIWQAGTLWAGVAQILAYGFGAFLGVYPDFDFVFTKKPERLEKLGGEHRSISHYPLITIPILALALIGIFSWKWAAAGIVAMIAHYVDDSLDKSGVQWLYPVSSNHFEFLRHHRLVNVRTPEDVKQNPPPQLQKWLEENFLRVCWRSVGNISYTFGATGMDAGRGNRFQAPPVAGGESFTKNGVRCADTAHQRNLRTPKLPVVVPVKIPVHPPRVRSSSLVFVEGVDLKSRLFLLVKERS